MIAKEYLEFKQDASILIFKDENKINLDNHEIDDFIPWWDEMIVESIETFNFIDYLDISFSQDSMDISKSAYYVSLAKLFDSYDLVILNSNRFKLSDDFEDNSLMLVVVEPTEKSIEEVKQIKFSDRAYLVLNKYNFEAVSEEIRDRISEIDLRMVAKFEDITAHSEQISQNVHKIMNILDLASVRS